MNNSTHKTPSLGYAALTFGICFAVMVIPVVIFGAEMHAMFLMSCLFAFYLCRRLGYSFSELQHGMMEYMMGGIIPILIALCVGSFIAILCSCGTIAYVTKVCLSVINPKYFMVLAFLICVVFSGFTGTSFGTTGTVGIALMGVGLSMGMDPLLVASPIISGAMFGDAFSPVSDTPNIASAATGLDLFKLIRYQTTTVTGPAMVICAIIYFFWGTAVGGGEANYEYIADVLNNVSASFNLGPILLIPLVVVLILLVRKVPVAPAILSGVFFGYLLAVFYQGYAFTDVAEFMWSGFVLESDDAFMLKLFNRGGMVGMGYTVNMVLCSFALFGILSTAGITDVLFKTLDRFAKTRVSATLTSLGMGVAINFASGSCGLAGVSVGTFMSPSYKRNKQNLWDLGRLSTVACLFATYLVPWSGDPVTVCGFLGVTPIKMIPYYIFIWVETAVLLFVTFTGIDKKFSAFARGEIPAYDEEDEAMESRT